MQNISREEINSYEIFYKNSLIYEYDKDSEESDQKWNLKDLFKGEQVY